MSVLNEFSAGWRRETPDQKQRKIERERKWRAVAHLRDAMTAEERAAEEERLAGEVRAMLAERNHAT